MTSSKKNLQFISQTKACRLKYVKSCYKSKWQSPTKRQRNGQKIGIIIAQSIESILKHTKIGTTVLVRQIRLWGTPLLPLVNQRFGKGVCWWGCEKLAPSCCQCGYRLAWSLQRVSWWFLTKWKIRKPPDPAISLLGIYPTGVFVWRRLF